MDAQRVYAELHNQTPFKPWSHFGDHRHNYEKVVPTLKYFSTATFFASFLAPLTYEQLEAREDTLGATYYPDLLDLLLAFFLFSYMDIVPLLHFGANIDALTPILLRGCHCEPNGDIISMLHTTMEIHESPDAFYSHTFLQLLCIPALKSLDFSQKNVHALEDCLRQTLMNLPLPQALDFPTFSCSAACVFHRLSARIMILPLLLRLLHLNDISDPIRAQYARLLAQNIPVSTSIDYGQKDRANLFQENSPLRCVLITQGGLLRQLCHFYSHLSTFIKKVCLAFNDESQQGGKAGFTVVGANLPCSCLQCLTGDQEQTKAGTGGEKLQEALVDQLAHKTIGFLGGSKPHLPSSMLFSLFKALRAAQVSNLPSDRDSPFDILQYLCDSCPSLACLLLFGKLKEWCPLPVSPYTSSFHILSDVLRALTSHRWPCIILIFNTPRDRQWPSVVMKIHSLTKWRPNSP